MVDLHDSTASAAPSAAFDPADVLECVETGVLVLAPDWRILYGNPAWAAMVGGERHTYLGRPLLDAFPALRGSTTEALLRATAADGVPREERLERASGTFRVVVRLSGGARLVCEVHDFAEQAAREREAAERSAEAEGLRALARSMAAESAVAPLLRHLCDAAMRQLAGDGSWVFEPREDGQGVCVAAAGITRDATGLVLPLAGSLFEEVAARGHPVTVDRYTPRGADAVAVGAHYGVGPVLMTPLAAHGQTIGVLAVVRRQGCPGFSAEDEGRLHVIADYASLALHKARLLQESQDANQLKNNFLATVSHELRTPLTALTGYGELLADGILGEMPKEQHDVVERMRSVTHHLAAMIDEILTFSSLEAGREGVRIGSVDVAEVVQEAIDVVEPLARQKGLPFTVRLDEPTLSLPTDADKVRQILVNLAGNAIKFTDAGEVSLVVERRAGQVRFAVRDTGPGISAEGRTRLFRPFSQLSSGLTRRHGGTGLGLYISQRLAHLLGGQIDLESEEGVGSTFTLCLPLAGTRQG